jgi:hypothetical protein
MILEIMHHPNFPELPKETLQEALLISSERGDMHSFSQLFKSVARMRQSYIDDAFILACKKNHYKIVEALSRFIPPVLASDGFNAAVREDALEVISHLLSQNSNRMIKQVDINRAFLLACDKKCFKTVEVLLGFVSPDWVSQRFEKEVEKGAVEIVSRLLSLASNQIEEKTINRAFLLACKKHFFKVIEALVGYVTPSSLLNGFLAAARKGAMEVVSKLLSLKKDVASLLSGALMEFVENHEMGGLSALTSSPEFAEIPTQEFVEALRIAAEGNYLDVLGKLSKTILFSELGSEDIEEVINRALEFGNGRFAEAILAIAEGKCSEPEPLSKLQSLVSNKVNYGKNKLLIAAKENDISIFPHDFLQNQEYLSLWTFENLTNFTSDALELILSEAIKNKSSNFLYHFLNDLKKFGLLEKLREGKLIKALVEAVTNGDQPSMSSLIKAGVSIDKGLKVAKQKYPLSAEKSFQRLMFEETVHKPDVS